MPYSSWLRVAQAIPVVIDGNSIFCDGYGCRAQDTFEGHLPREEIQVRYHMLGWRYTEVDGQELHYCPIHL